MNIVESMRFALDELAPNKVLMGTAVCRSGP